LNIQDLSESGDVGPPEQVSREGKKLQRRSPSVL